MLHIIFIIILIFIILFTITKCLISLEEKFTNLDNKLISKFKKNNIMKFFIGNDESTENTDNIDKIKLKRVNQALRFDLCISTLLGILWFFYPFMLIHKTRLEIMFKSPDDRYLGRWISLILLFSNIYSLRYINNGEIFSKQYILLIKLFCAILVILTSTIITCIIKKIYLSNILNIILVSIWFSNSLVGIFFSYKNKDKDNDTKDNDKR